MFASTKRAIVVPQSEHLRLCGALALHWGNARFALPAIDRAALLLGIATHDRAFGELDTAEIRSITSADRAAQVERWIATGYANIDAEIVVLNHVRRLMSWGNETALCARLDARIAELMPQATATPDAFAEADTITDLCDSIAFDFCYEHETERRKTVTSGAGEMAELTYRVNGVEITVDPWPFSVTAFEGYVLGYEAEGYPKHLQPLLMPYRICRAESA
ncbi:DUF3891 family protein [Paracoccaceae bacterium GXU_MW_L88]